MKLALFDFDGTVSKKDSLLDFLEYSFGRWKVYFGFLMLFPIIIKYKIGLTSNQSAKEKLIKYFYGNYSTGGFKKLADEYSDSQLEKIIRLKALDRVLWHKKQGHDVVIVSASIECWLKPWCSKYKVELISTKLEVKDNYLTGKFLTRNCHGVEKVNRIRQQYDLSKYDHIYAYGDSKGDKEMLDLADESYFKPFR